MNSPSRVCSMAGSGPRRSHPAPSQPPAVARVTPLVPEVSLFLHSGGGGGPIPRYGGWNNNNDKGQGAMSPPLRQQLPAAAADKPPSFLNQSSGLMSARARPPSPHQPLLQGILKPMQDFSRLFDSSLSLCTEGGNSWPPATKESAPVVTRGGISSETGVRFSDRVEGIATQVPVERPASYARSSPALACGSTSYKAGPDRETARPYESAFPGLREAVSPPAARVRSKEARLEESPAVPPEILRVLNWQNEQLKLLQEQVKLLLESSPLLNRSESTLRKESPQQQHQQQHQQLPQHQQTYPEAANSGRASSTVATNTSTLWPEIQQGLARLQLIVEQEEEGEGDESSNYGEINKENIPVSSHFLATYGLKGLTGQIRSAREWYHWIAHGYCRVHTYLVIDFKIFNLSLICNGV